MWRIPLAFAAPVKNMVNNEKRLLRHIAATAVAVILTILLMGFSADRALAKSSKYLLKINTRTNVVTAYKSVGGRWKPVRAMLCTSGARPKHTTPTGTFRMGYQRRWLTMIDEKKNKTNEQYTSLVSAGSQIYIHSVWYYRRSHSAQSSSAFNRLGHSGSHGCIRVSTMDAKWIYDHCNPGTGIIVFSSPKKGPLGRPKKIYSPSSREMNWDPTDPKRGNPIFRMHKPKFIFKKKRVTYYGKKYALKDKIKVINPNANQDISNGLKVLKLTRNGKKTSVKGFSTEKVGKYKATYYIRDPYMVKAGGKSTKKSFSFAVHDRTSVKAESYSLEQNQTNAVKNVTAAALSGDLTSSLKVSITTPEKNRQVLTFEDAQNYVFDKVGKYKVTYTAFNPYPKKKVSKTITVEVTAPSGTPEQPVQPVQPAE